MSYAWQPGPTATAKHYWLRLTRNPQQCRCPRCYQAWRANVLEMLSKMLVEGEALMAAVWYDPTEAKH